MVTDHSTANIFSINSGSSGNKPDAGTSKPPEFIDGIDAFGGSNQAGYCDGFSIHRGVLWQGFVAHRRINLGFIRPILVIVRPGLKGSCE
jgi:hypothetical protein